MEAYSSLFVSITTIFHPPAMSSNPRKFGTKHKFHADLFPAQVGGDLGYEK